MCEDIYKLTRVFALGDFLTMQCQTRERNRIGDEDLSDQIGALKECLGGFRVPTLLEPLVNQIR